MKNYNTKQKEILLTFFKENPDKQYTINEITESICTNNIGKSTVYRLVKNLTDDEIIRCFYDEKSKITLYQYADKQENCNSHFHLKCSGCNRMFHLQCEHTTEIKEHIASIHNFAIDMSKTIFFGYCENCQKERTSI